MARCIDCGGHFERVDGKAVVPCYCGSNRTRAEFIQQLGEQLRTHAETWNADEDERKRIAEMGVS